MHRPCHNRTDLIAVAVALAIVAAAPGVPHATSNYDILREQVESVISEGFDPSRMAVFIEDCDAPIVIAEHNADTPMAAGACQSLLTTAAALEALGPGFRYRTMVACSGEPINSQLHGNLVVTESGDPTIGGRFEDDRSDITAVFRRWAAEIR